MSRRRSAAPRAPAILGSHPLARRGQPSRVVRANPRRFFRWPLAASSGHSREHMTFNLAVGNPESFETGELAWDVAFPWNGENRLAQFLSGQHLQHARRASSVELGE